MSLSDFMEFNRVIRVHADGSIGDGPKGIYAPTMLDDELDDSSWTFFSTGYTGQYGYRGPTMHSSESIGGQLARDTLAQPGLYVAIVSDHTPEDDANEDEDTVEGWAIAYREDES